VAGAVVLALAGGAALASRSTRAPSDVASIVVTPRRFVREVSADGVLRAVRATPIVAPMEAGREQKVAFHAPDGSRVKAGDVVFTFDPYDAEREAADGRAEVSSADAQLRKTRAEGEKNRVANTADRALANENARRAEEIALTDEGIFSRHELIESRLDREQSRKRAEATTRRADVGERLARADVSVGEVARSKAALKVRQAERALAALRATAPHDGLFVLARGWNGELVTVGQSVWPGQPLGEIPDLSRLEARVWVLEADAGGLKPGLSASVSFDGRPGAAHVATVSKVEAVAKPRYQMSPVRYFETTLSLARTEVAWMRPGQNVRALVRLEELDSVLAVPRAALFDRDGKRVVFRWDGQRFDAVEVVAGASSVSRIVVQKGLAPGDRVALRDPARKPAAVESPVAGAAAP
jgi:multidrug efflux pump subunit AcrA (membrane-fusion protein)